MVQGEEARTQPRSLAKLRRQRAAFGKVEVASICWASAPERKELCRERTPGIFVAEYQSAHIGVELHVAKEVSGGKVIAELLAK